MMNNYKIMLAHKKDRPEVMDFIISVYREMSPLVGRSQKIIFSFEPSLKDQNLILARSSTGELIGVIRLVERSLIVDKTRLKSCGITSVAVRPDWRGRGVCQRMMKEAIKLMTERKFDLSILHARRALDGFYVQFGFHGIGRYIDLEILNPSAQTSSLKTSSICQEDIDLLSKLYDRTYLKLNGSMVRTSAMWRLFMEKISQGVLQAKILIFQDRSHKVGYGIILEDKLVELAIPEKYFSDIVSWVQQRSLKLISLHPCHPFFKYCRGQFNTLYKERFAHDGGYMARIINSKGKLKKMPLDYFIKSKGMIFFNPGPHFHTCVLDEV